MHFHNEKVMVHPVALELWSALGPCDSTVPQFHHSASTHVRSEWCRDRIPQGHACREAPSTCGARTTEIITLASSHGMHGRIRCYPLLCGKKWLW